jgi:hypothetical protein
MALIPSCALTRFQLEHYSGYHTTLKWDISGDKRSHLIFQCREGDLRISPFIPFVVTNTRQANHFLHGFRRVEPSIEFNFDEPVRLTIAPQLDPNFGLPHILIKSNPFSPRKFVTSRYVQLSNTFVMPTE